MVTRRRGPSHSGRRVGAGFPVVGIVRFCHGPSLDLDAEWCQRSMYHLRYADALLDRGDHVEAARMLEAALADERMADEFLYQAAQGLVECGKVLRRTGSATEATRELREAYARRCVEVLERISPEYLAPRLDAFDRATDVQRQPAFDAIGRRRPEAGGRRLEEKGTS